MSFEETLKTKIPEYQQGNLQLDELLEAVGELLDNFKGAIDNFQNYNDFQLIPESLLNDIAKQFDIEFPRNMSPDK